MKKTTKKLTAAQKTALEAINRRKASDLVTSVNYTWNGQEYSRIIANGPEWSAYAGSKGTQDALARKGLVFVARRLDATNAYVRDYCLPASELESLPEGFKVLPTPEKAKATSTPAKGYELGQAVEVHAFGRWYAGTVVKLGRTRVTVRYTTGTGATRDKAVDGSQVRTTGGQAAKAPEAPAALVWGSDDW